MDQEIGSLSRALKADPTNGAAALALLHARARVDGSELYLEPLQDLAIKETAPESESRE